MHEFETSIDLALLRCVGAERYERWVLEASEECERFSIMEEVTRIEIAKEQVASFYALYKELCGPILLLTLQAQEEEGRKKLFGAYVKDLQCFTQSSESQRAFWKSTIERRTTVECEVVPSS